MNGHDVQGAYLSVAAAVRRASTQATLIAVSKRHPPSALRAAYEAGARDFGENYVAELNEKREALADLPGIRWHFIGRFQSNKAKLLDGIHMVHTLSSVKHVRALARLAMPPRALIQVNIDREPQKGGIAPDELEGTLDALAPAQRPAGLMAIPRAADGADAFERLSRLGHAHWASPVLSMGMSQDWQAAIAAGATHVRVGTAIFGKRQA